MVRITLILVTLLIACRSQPTPPPPVDAQVPAPLTQDQSPGPVETTKKILTNWGNNLLNMVGNLGYVPSELTDVPSDGWGRPTRYTRIGPGCCKLCSSGEDGIWDNAGDICANVTVERYDILKDPMWSVEKQNHILRWAQKPESYKAPIGVFRKDIPPENLKDFDTYFSRYTGNIIKAAKRSEMELRIQDASDMLEVLANLTGNPKWIKESDRLKGMARKAIGAAVYPIRNPPEIYQDFSSNELSAADKYRDWFWTGGVIESVAVTFDGTPYVLLKAGGWFRNVQCLFPEEYSGQLGELKKGNRAYFPCHNGRKSIGYPMVDCRPGSLFQVNKSKTAVLGIIRD